MEAGARHIDKFKYYNSILNLILHLFSTIYLSYKYFYKYYVKIRFQSFDWCRNSPAGFCCENHLMRSLPLLIGERIELWPFYAINDSLYQLLPDFLK